MAPAVYRFPNEDTVYVAFLNRARGSTADKLLLKIKELSNSPRDYDAVRAAFCACSVALNEMRVFPPRVRETRRPGRYRKLTDEEKVVSHDRQMIDLHWLHATRQGTPEKKWEGVLGKADFDFEHATKFLLKVGYAETKAKVLRLPLAAQFELATIQSKVARDAWRAIEEVEGNVIADVAAARSRPRPPAVILEIMPHAYKALRIADGAPSVAVQVMRRFWAIKATEAKVRRCRDWLVNRGRLIGK